MAKSTKQTVAARVEEVLLLRLQGAQAHDIVRYGAENGWGVGRRQVEKYVRAADARLAATRDRDRDLVVALHLARRENLYRLAVIACDYGTARAVLEDEAKLLGLYPPAPRAARPALPARGVRDAGDGVRIMKVDRPDDVGKDRAAKGAAPAPLVVGGEADPSGL